MSYGFKKNIFRKYHLTVKKSVAYDELKSFGFEMVEKKSCKKSAKPIPGNIFVHTYSCVPQFCFFWDSLRLTIFLLMSARSVSSQSLTNACKNKQYYNWKFWLRWFSSNYFSTKVILFIIKTFSSFYVQRHHSVKNFLGY